MDVKSAFRYGTIEDEEVGYYGTLEETTVLSTTEEGLQAIFATINGHEKLITEDSLRRHLKLYDAKGISSLSNEEIFEHLAHMGSKKTAWDQFSSNIATTLICLATSRKFNFSKFIFEAMVKNLDSPHNFLLYPRQGERQRLFFIDDEEITKDSSKQGRKISQIDEDPTVSLVQDEGIYWIPQEEKVHKKPNDETGVLVQEETPTEINDITCSNEEEFVDPKILHTKFPIVDWESQNLGNMHVYMIIRADGNTSYHKIFKSMLKSFDRHDLEVLHRLVMERFQDNTLEGYNLILWGDLKILVDPEQVDDIWKNQNSEQ
ncbi:hypothetical protein Tco_0895171 [Tanacetum coccineum]|uniref:Uncharacterized protein n=1 Tax=Tanacetum coccineum TaxID=301880 RepID=A0ABQ5CF10_9ASTR